MKNLGPFSKHTFEISEIAGGTLQFYLSSIELINFIESNKITCFVPSS